MLALGADEADAAFVEGGDDGMGDGQVITVLMHMFLKINLFIKNNILTIT